MHLWLMEQSVFILNFWLLESSRKMILATLELGDSGQIASYTEKTSDVFHIFAVIKGYNKG